MLVLLITLSFEGKLYVFVPGHFVNIVVLTRLNIVACGANS